MWHLTIENVDGRGRALMELVVRLAQFYRSKSSSILWWQQIFLWIKIALVNKAQKTVQIELTQSLFVNITPILHVLLVISLKNNHEIASCIYIKLRYAILFDQMLSECQEEGDNKEDEEKAKCTIR